MKRIKKNINGKRESIYKNNREKVNKYYRDYYKANKAKFKERARMIYEKRKEQRIIEKHSLPLNIKQKNLLFNQNMNLVEPRRKKILEEVNKKLKNKKKDIDEMSFDELFNFLLKKEKKE